MDWPLGGWPRSPALTALLAQIPKAQAKLLLCFCCMIFSRRKGFLRPMQWELFCKGEGYSHSLRKKVEGKISG